MNHPSVAPPREAPARESLRGRYAEVRRFSGHLCAPLSPEDCVIQSMPDVSPTRWHLAHATWFFETFVLTPFARGYKPYHPQFAYLFNSYYNAVGPQFPRPQRGFVSRPGVAEIWDYRRAVDEAMEEFLASAGAETLARVLPVMEIGLNHEQQHQELILTDIKHVLSGNPIHPAYREREDPPPAEAPALRWLSYGEGVRWIGHAGEGFAFDNESPRHRQFLEPHQLASRLVTNGDYLEFMRDGGYARPAHWLSLGWAAVQREGWRAPLYWLERDGQWFHFTLAGLKPVDPAGPVCHVSYFEADACARWAGARLPTEGEWEAASADAPLEGNLAGAGRYHPAPAPPGARGPAQMFGDVWEWTSSSYGPYPGYRAAEGALGEYNGKFM
ncbi:MAG: ergothioneine biosynthesis protein EgtB, partial [Nitrospinota bacterium]